MQPHGTEPGQAALALSTPLRHQLAALHPSPSQHAQGGGFALALSLPLQTQLVALHPSQRSFALTSMGAPPPGTVSGSVSIDDWNASPMLRDKFWKCKRCSVLMPKGELACSSCHATIPWRP